MHIKIEFPEYFNAKCWLQCVVADEEVAHLHVLAFFFFFAMQFTLQNYLFLLQYNFSMELTFHFHVQSFRFHSTNNMRNSSSKQNVKKEHLCVVFFSCKVFNGIVCRFYPTNWTDRFRFPSRVDFINVLNSESWKNSNCERL